MLSVPLHRRIHIIVLVPVFSLLTSYFFNMLIVAPVIVNFARI